jgi:voltage-gated potassium channel Kch
MREPGVEAAIPHTVASGSGDGPRLGDRQPVNGAYELFLGGLTLISLVVMVLLVFVRLDVVFDILLVADTMFCAVFLMDVARSFRRAPSKRGYLFPQGVLDLLGSIPAVGIFRVFRVFRLLRIVRLVGARGGRGVLRDLLANRAEAAGYLIVLAVFLVLIVGGSLVAIVEAPAGNANIRTASDALWWTFVTIATVGYGDLYPVTTVGRIVGVITMAVGIALFGVLTSFLAQAFLRSRAAAPAWNPGTGGDGASAGPVAGDVAGELSALRAELATIRQLLEASERRP